MTIIQFYRGDSTDLSGRTFDDVLNFSDGEMEYVHDYIQWLFPLPEPSRAQPQSPIMTEEELKLFQEDVKVRKRVLDAFDRWMDFMEKTSHWLKSFDHNHLRITRIIRFLTLAGFPEEAEQVHQTALGMMKKAGTLTPKTRKFWRDARKAA